MHDDLFLLTAEGVSDTMIDWMTKRFRRDQFVFSPRFQNLEEAMCSGPGVLDLFSGQRGFSKAITRLLVHGRFALI